MGRRRKGKKSQRRVRSKKYETTDDDNNQIPPPEWVININNCLEDGHDLDTGRSWTIYRVPKNMVQVHRSAYIPKIISIGPFHYGDPRLQAMEEHKMRYLFRILGYTRGGQLEINSHSHGDEEEQVQLAEHQRHKSSNSILGYTSGELNVNGHSHHEEQDDQVILADKRRPGSSSWRVARRKDIKIECLEGAMKALECKTRECYSEPFYDIDSDDFVQMMVIDGCFVIELLRLYYEYYLADDEEHTVDPIFTTRWMLRSLQRDLLMLQNQLPFFVLEELFMLTSSREKDNIPLIELTLMFFDPLIPRAKNNMQEIVNPNINHFDHMLDLFRTSFISSIKQKKPISKWKKPCQATPTFRFTQEMQWNHCVTELQEAGVTFMKKEENDLLDIEYEDGVLVIPPLYIDDNTVPLFLNFVAYEQCDEDAEPYFTNHFMFFDILVNSARDVQILHNNGIINHCLGSDKDVADLFNKVCREIVYDVDKCHLCRQMIGVNDYYKAYYSTRWHVWWTNLIHGYFSSPWAFLSLLAAIVLLLLTTAQTFLAIFAYFKPPKPF